MSDEKLTSDHVVVAANHWLKIIDAAYKDQGLSLLDTLADCSSADERAQIKLFAATLEPTARAITALRERCMAKLRKQDPKMAEWLEAGDFDYEPSL